MRPLRLDAQQWVIPPDTGLVSHHLRHAARHALTRRAFIGSMAAVAGAAAGAGLIPALAHAAKPSSIAPVPTPNTVVIGGLPFHFTSFGPGIDPSSINDFNGFVGVADVQGTGTATNPDGSTETLLFDTDMRFMNGVYVGADGAVHKGTFGFV
jgi:hypothetical protein